VGTHSIERFIVGILIAAVFVLAVALAQGIGQSIGGGLSEWLVP